MADESAAGGTKTEDQAAAPAHTDLPIVDVGRYQLKGEVARGGIGRIVAARDLRLGRDVALKEILRPGGEARLVREALIAARLQHPAIVPIFDAGRRLDGTPFVAMKLVDGRSLDDVIAAARTLAQRMALLPVVIAVADAIAYAHSRGVIHRDLKPANVLVGAFGETSVVDWGLAKELDRPDAPPTAELAAGSDDGVATRAGTVLGTPAYMPPEQARGEAVDTRADVYALGALLYHVLAGAPPYQSTPGTTAMAQLHARPPEPVEERQPGVPPDLAAIVGKAMARDPGARYPDAGPLAEDLRRFQTGKLVTAHDYSFTALGLRWLRRHRGIVAVAAVAALALSIVGALAVRRVVAERDRAEKQRAAAEDLAEFMLSDLRGRLAGLGRLDVLGGVGERVVRYYDALPADAVDAAALARRARALGVAGSVRIDAGDLEGAKQLLERALAGDHGTPLDRARLLERLGDVEEREGHAEIAMATLARARDLAAASPDDIAAREELGLLESLIGLRLAKEERPDAAVPHLRIALELERGLLAGRPAADALLRNLVHTERSLARLTIMAGQVTEGRELLDDAVARCAAALRERADDPSWTVELEKAHYQRADALIRLGRLDDALADDEVAVAAARRLVARDEDNQEWAVELAQNLVKRAEDLGEKLDADRALAALAEAGALVGRAAAREPKNLVWGHEVWDVAFKTGTIRLRVKEDKPGAAASYEQALAALEAVVAADPSSGWWQVELGETSYELGQLETELGRRDAARMHIDRSVAILEERAATASADVEIQKRLGAAYTARSALHEAEHEIDAAVADVRRALSVDERLASGNPKGVPERLILVRDHLNIGLLYAPQRTHAAEARAELLAALAGFDELSAEGKVPEPYRPWRADIVKRLAALPR